MCSQDQNLREQIKNIPCLKNYSLYQLPSVTPIYLTTCIDKCISNTCNYCLRWPLQDKYQLYVTSNTSEILFIHIVKNHMTFATCLLNNSCIKLMTIFSFVFSLGHTVIKHVAEAIVDGYCSTCPPTASKSEKKDLLFFQMQLSCNNSCLPHWIIKDSVWNQCNGY